MASKKPAKSPATDKKTDDKRAIKEVFGDAAIMEEPAKSKEEKGDYVQMGNGKDSLQGYVAILLVKKALEAQEERLSKRLKNVDAFTYFHNQVVKTGAQPEPVIGVEENASAQFQCRKKPNFDENVAKMLADAGVNCERAEQIPERFVINPLLLEDQAMMGKLAVAIQGLRLDYQVVIKQQPKYKFNVTKETYLQISKIKDSELRSRLLASISIIAVAQPQLDVDGDVIAAALDILREKNILGD